MTYLGLPLGKGGNAATVSDGVEEKFRKKLAWWKSHYILKGGRLTLIRSTLSNIPTYLMSLFPLPRGVMFRLEKIQRYFLWGGGSLERKLHLINWNTVYGSQESGGLGIRDLTLRHKALLGKWTWKFVMKGDTIWMKLPV